MLEWSLGYDINVQDVVINVLGFVPFGFLGVFWMVTSRRVSLVAAAFTTLLIAFTMSLGIEVAQAYLPTRNSSLLDLITNVAGTIFGVIAACTVMRRNCAAKPSNM